MGLIWERLAQQSTSLQPALSRTHIVAVALALADAEGLQAITMRRIATALGSAPMSLYRHIAHKDDLLDLMLDAVFGEIELGPSSGDWQTDLRTLAQGTRVIFMRHPWIMPLLNSRPTIGPNYLRWFDHSLGIVASLGLDIATISQLIGVLFGYVIGVVNYEVAEAETTRRTGFNEDDKRAYATASPYLQQIISSGHYPHFARYFNATVAVDPEQSFAFGLDCLLAGFTARLAG